MNPRSLLCLTLLAIAVVGSGCAQTLMERPVPFRSDDRWSFVVKKVTDGPHGFTALNATKFVPEKNQRFLWVYLSLRNDAPTEREFDFGRCDLELGDDRSLPLWVGLAMSMDGEMPRKPRLKAGETIERKLVFGYPKDRLPTTFSCDESPAPLALSAK
jgi:hypothetical protein